MNILKNPILFTVLVSFLLISCNQEPVEIHYGSDECAHCRMMITEQQFAAQLVTKKGKVYKFDAIECLAAYNNQNGDDFTAPMLWVTNYNKPGEWLNVKNAQFVKSEEINSPMGESLLALPSFQKAEEHIAERPGTIMNWEEVTQIIQ
jgi:copper chaperone NosL